MMNMLGIVLALFAALAYSISSVLIRSRLNGSNFFYAVFICTVIGTISLWPLALLFTNLGTINPEGVLFFIIAGIGLLINIAWII